MAFVNVCVYGLLGTRSQGRLYGTCASLSHRYRGSFLQSRVQLRGSGPRRPLRLPRRDRHPSPLEGLGPRGTGKQPSSEMAGNVLSGGESKLGTPKCRAPRRGWVCRTGGGQLSLLSGAEGMVTKVGHLWDSQCDPKLVGGAYWARIWRSQGISFSPGHVCWALCWVQISSRTSGT